MKLKISQLKNLIKKSLLKENLSSKIVQKALAFPNETIEISITPNKIKFNTAGIIRASGYVVNLPKQHCSFKERNVWMIGWMSADKGWGPLFYDLMLELVSQDNGILMADRATTKPEAAEVWNKYFLERPEIIKHRLDVNSMTLEYYFGDNRPINHITPDPSDDCMQISSFEHAVGYGDYQAYDEETRKNAVIDNVELAKNWENQSISYGYSKTTDEVYQILKNKFIQY